jgi:peptide/nickel transport system substrate-binding protein
LLALVVGFTLLAAACGDDDEGGGAGATTTAAGGDQQQGGEIVIGAEQYPECINPITQCANSSWMHWAVVEHVLPRLMELDTAGNFVPSPVLAGPPELTGEGSGNGTGPFTVTYTIDPEAVWDDGTPITSSDVRFTWEAQMQTTGALSTVGFEDIESVDDSDPTRAVVTFTRPFADWADLFGGASTYVYKADAFSDPDTSDELATEIPFSGAPFKLESFSATEALLVRNDAYWDDERMPLLDSVRVVPLTDTETELNALLAGEVDAIYPQPAPGIAEQLDADEIQLTFGAGTTYEGLWMNIGSLKNPNTPLKSAAVREALMYAVDRQQILEQIIHPNFPETELLNCGGWVPTVGDWCDQSDFEDVQFDADRVAELLEGDGWAKGGDGIYAKDGQRLSITWQTVAGNKRREDIQALVIPAAREVGIELVADNSDADTLFQVRNPQLDTELALYAQVASPDPSVTTIFHCDNIPSEANEFSGQNSVAWCDDDASALMTESDETPDEDARLELTHQIGDMVREAAVFLPFYQLPLITAWNSDRLDGPVDAYTSSTYSAFENLYDWSLK